MEKEKFLLGQGGGEGHACWDRVKKREEEAEREHPTSQPLSPFSVPPIKQDFSSATSIKLSTERYGS
ncbi:hypothetical protein MRB53_007526 [Persea americana]|uniref:Uncharacterized protein n=1 Tax=Persea americana TaxID=3435 RepID=A0ACC2MK91_PERAE|nr:hypothetical protein MRB53_007526 [Persea americana]